MHVELPYGKRYEIGTFVFSEIEIAAPDAPGLYGWYVVPWNYNSAPKAAALLSHVYVANEMHVTVTSPPRLQYDGPVTQSNEVPAVENASIDFYVSSALAFAAPLYIGKAAKQTLRDRLSQHVRVVRKLTESSYSEDMYVCDSDSEQNDSDNAFADRIRIVAKNTPGFSNAHLLVKTVSASANGDDVEAMRKGIHEVEQFWLSTLGPKISRR